MVGQKYQSMPQQMVMNPMGSKVKHHLETNKTFGILGGSSQLGYVVNNHGDRKSPNSWGCGTPFNWPKFMACKWGVTNYLLIGMILQAAFFKVQCICGSLGFIQNHYGEDLRFPSVIGPDHHPFPPSLRGRGSITSVGQK